MNALSHVMPIGASLQYPIDFFLIMLHFVSPGEC